MTILRSYAKSLSLHCKQNTNQRIIIFISEIDCSFAVTLEIKCILQEWISTSRRDQKVCLWRQTYLNGHLFPSFRSMWFYPFSHIYTETPLRTINRPLPAKDFQIFVVSDEWVWLCELTRFFSIFIMFRWHLFAVRNIYTCKQKSATELQLSFVRMFCLVWTQQESRAEYKRTG